MQVVAASWNYSVALTAGASPAFQLSNPTWSANGFTVSLPSQIGSTYTLQYLDSLSGGNWTSLSSVSGNGEALTLSDTSATGNQRFYRVRKR